MDYKRLFIPNSYIYIIIVTYNRKNIFIEYIDIVKKAFKHVKEFFGFKIVSVCILPDHIHLILHPQNINEYPKIITAIKYFISKNINNVGVETPTYGYKNKGEKGIFQRRYYEHTILNKNDLINQINYIHYNPVKHSLVKNVSGWRYSSFSRFVSNGFYEARWGSTQKDILGIKDLYYE